jgi:hypothetical protein
VKAALLRIRVLFAAAVHNTQELKTAPRAVMGCFASNIVTFELPTTPEGAGEPCCKSSNYCEPCRFPRTASGRDGDNTQRTAGAAGDFQGRRDDDGPNWWKLIKVGKTG